MGKSLSSVNIKFFVDLKEFSTKFQNAERKIKKMGKSMQKMGKSLTSAVSLPIIAIGGYALKSAADLETMETAFTSMLGSGEKAKQLTKELIDFTAKTPFQLNGVGKSAKQLLAFGVAQEDVLKKMKILGDVSAGANVPLSDMAAIYGKIKAKGKAMTEEILQMSDRGIPIIQVLADQFNVAKSEIFKMAKEGKISFASIEKGLQSMTTKGGIFDDQMAKQSNTLAGLASTLKDNVNLAFAQLGIEISKAFNLKELIAKFVKNIQGAVKWFTNLSDETKKFIVVMGGIATVVGPLVALAGTIIPAMVTGFGLLISPIGLVVAGIAAIGVAVVKNWSPIRKILVDFANYFVDLYNQSTVFRVAVEGIALWFKNLWSISSFVLRAIGDALSFLAEKFVSKFKTIGAVIKAVLTGSFSDLPEIAKKAADSSSQSFGDLIDNLKTDFKQLGIDVANNTSNALNKISKRVKIKYLEENIDTTALENKTAKAVQDGIKKGTGKKKRPEAILLNEGKYQGDNPEMAGLADIEIKSPLEGMGDKTAEELALVTESTDAYAANMGRLQEISTAVGGAMSEAFSSMASSLVDSMGLADKGFAGFVKGILKSVLKLVATQLASAIATSIASATAAASSTGPAAVVTTPAFIATNVGAVTSAFAAMPKFANGGIMGGTSFFGDKLFARINSKEMVLNQKQQYNLAGMLQPITASPQALALSGEFRISGNDLALSLKRTNNRNNRLE